METNGELFEETQVSENVNEEIFEETQVSENVNGEIIEETQVSENVNGEIIEETQISENFIVDTDINESHLVLANYCQKVYSDDYLEDAEDFVDHPETDCQAVLFKDPNEERLIVCFRGSDSITDWRMNFNMRTAEFPRGSGREVHSGFLIQYLSIKNDLKIKLENLIKKHGTKTITFCGHSAGVISAVAIYDLGPELIKQTQSIDIVTFGAPRFCDQAFQEYFDAHFKCVRCVLDRDVITLCPFGVLGYYHVGKLLQMMDGGKIQRTELTLWQKFTWSLLGIAKFDFGVRDHFIFNYTDEIRKICSK